jgi:hypothetical protein
MVLQSSSLDLFAKRDRIRLPHPWVVAGPVVLALKTQLMALGVQADYVDYMMGHTVDTYHDIQMKGVEFLRNIYASAGFSIRPRSQPSKIEMVKEFIRGLGMHPEEILTRQALSEPHRAYTTNQQREDDQIKALLLAFKENLKKELNH